MPSKREPWPVEAQWRGDLRRWEVTLGTAMNLLDNAGSGGLTPSEVALELARLRSKYGSVDDMSLRETSESLETAGPRVVTWTNAAVAWKRSESDGSDGDTGPVLEYADGRLVLTATGKKELARIYAAFAGSAAAKSKSVDMREPLLSWRPNIDGTGGWGIDDSALAPRRVTKKKLTYRQWLTMMHKESKMYVGLHERLNVGKSPAPGSAEESEQKTGVTARHRQIKPVREFAKMILGGGPESVWMGKPLIPGDVHNDVEAFYTAKKPGFDQKTLKASSLAWELYETDEFSMNEYSAYREILEMQAAEGRTIRAAGEGTLSVADATGVPTIYARTAGYDGEGVLESYDPGAQNVVLEQAGDAMAARITNPLEFGKIAADGTVAPVRCTYRKLLEDGREKLCTHTSVPGTTRCEMHGGLLADPEETRMMIVAAQMKMFQLSDVAVSTIADVMVNGTNESNRLRAAETILNRSGIVEGAEISINGKSGKASPDGETPGDIIRKRLQSIAGAIARDEQVAEDLAAEERDDAAGEIIDADVDPEEDREDDAQAG